MRRSPGYREGMRFPRRLVCAVLGHQWSRFPGIAAMGCGRCDRIMAPCRHPSLARHTH